VTDEASAAHRHSHRTLLRPASRRSPRTVDAIVVSAARSALHLVPAMELADALGTRLVALCSRATDVCRAADFAAEFRYADITLVDVSDYGPPDLLRFGTDQSEVRVVRLGDLSRKRNLALYLAHSCSWESILLLDDDIRDLSLAAVRRATGTLRRGGVTGMIAEDFPDNSVVCHARRAAGLPQQVFISGSAMLVDTRTVDSYFPEVYNEDWLFMHDRVRAGRAMSLGRVRQLRYAPYADPERAAGEEFGDTLAEGLMCLVHEGRPVSDAMQQQWWRAVLAERRAMLTHLVAKLPDGDAKAAVLKAAEQHDYLEPSFFARYVTSWRNDIAELPGRFAAAPRDLPLETAVKQLGLVAVQSSGEQFLEQSGVA
jgi:hypothetical protein